MMLTVSKYGNAVIKQLPQEKDVLGISLKPNTIGSFKLHRSSWAWALDLLELIVCISAHNET